jgi:ATP-dependent DNA helicase UvrD/PcrA
VSRHEAGANPEQVAVIRHRQGPCQVLAVAGCGKTFAAVRRVASLVEEGVDPERIVMLTFSRKAADEMDQRVRHLGVGGVSCQTWHSLCKRILVEDGHPAAAWTVDDKDRAKGLVKQAIGYKHENWVGADVARVRKFIAHCKANAFEVDSPEAAGLARKMFQGQAERAIRVFSVSQDLIETAGLLTFDDMLVFAHRHLRDSEENRANWAGRFDYVITDEAQDNSRVQVELQEMLSRDHRNIMVVGDPAQAIYSFRGSSPDYLVEFREKWSTAERETARVAMCRNYRSGRAIVAAANAIIRPATVRLPEEMSGERDLDGKVDVVACETLDDEAGELVEFARRYVADGGKLSDITVLFRLNAQSRALEDALLKAKLPYVMVGGTNFYERKEVKDLLAYLRVAANRDRDGDGIRRCINAPFRFLGAKFVERVMALRAESGPVESWSNIVHIAAQQAGIQRRQVASVSEWNNLLADVQNLINPDSSCHAGPYETLDHIVRKTNYIAWIEKEEGAEDSVDSSHGANVRELLRVAQSFRTVGDLLDYVDQNIAESARQKRGKRDNSLTLMTIHRSKGLEWPVVWVVGCNETIFPHVRGDLEEERRLMYVAATRARDHLVFSHVHELMTRVGLKSVDRSQFLAGVEVPAEPDYPFVEPSADELVGEVVEPPAVAESVCEISGNAGARAWLGRGTCADCGLGLEVCKCGEMAANE